MSCLFFCGNYDAFFQDFKIYSNRKVILNYNISQNYFFCCIFDQINVALVSLKGYSTFFFGYILILPLPQS